MDHSYMRQQYSIIPFSLLANLRCALRYLSTTSNPALHFHTSRLPILFPQLLNSSSSSMAQHASPVVLIVGAGPTGLTLAIELLRRNVSCRLIDKLDGPRHTSRSFTVHARTLELFQQIGLVDSFLSDCNLVNGFIFNFKGKDVRPTLDFSSLDTPHPYILICSQMNTETRVREYLHKSFNFAPEWGTQLIRLSQQNDLSNNSITATLRHSSDRSEETLQPAYVVACDGTHSFVRTAVGIENTEAKYEGMIAQLMDAKVRNFPGTDDWIHYHMSKDSFFLLAKLPEDCHRIVVSNMRQDVDPSLSQHQFFQQVINGHLESATLDQPKWATKWQIWKRLAQRYSVGNVFLAGDAAHVHSPSGGQGMNVGMQDAFNLGWKLALVIHGFAARSLLDTYEKERKPIAAQAIEGSGAMHDVIMAHGKGMKDRLELTQAPGWHDAAVSRISGLSYHYRDTAELPEALALPGNLLPGDRAPDREISGHGRLLDILKNPYLSALLITTPSSPQPDIAYVREVVETSFAKVMKLYVVDTVGDDDSFLGTYGSFSCGHLYVLRPDGYVYLHCTLDHIDEFVTFMKNRFHGDEAVQ